MEESTAMARSQQARGLIYHATGTSYELDAAGMEESATMACSEQARGVIHILMGFAAKINAAGIEQSAVMNHRTIEPLINTSIDP